MVRFIASPSVFYNPARPFTPLALLAANCQSPGRLDDDGNLELFVADVRPLSIALVRMFIEDGGRVESLPIAIKMSAETYAEPVTDGLRNATDADGNPRVWSEWSDELHQHKDAADEDKIVMGNSYGSELGSDELAALVTDDRLELYMSYQVLAMLPEEADG